MKQPIAKYKITDTFKITGRGLVFAGTILDGTINPGNFIKFAALNILRIRKITGVEYISKPSQDPSNIGMLIECVDENELNELRNWTPVNSIGLVYKA